MTDLFIQPPAQTMSTLGLLAEGDIGWFSKFWFRTRASTFAGETDNVYYFIFWISALFFVVLMWLMLYWGIKYRRRPGVAAIPSISHNTPLEVVWTVIPTILLFVMFFWGFKGYMDKAIAPVDAEVIQVTAKKWNWTFEYKNGAKSRETERIADTDAPVFALPLNRPVKFIMSSDDVIHSMFIPDFRMKRDVMPNRFTTQWAQAIGKPTHTVIPDPEDPKKNITVPLDAEGLPITAKDQRYGHGYYLFCTEYCGDSHSQMVGRIMTMTDVDYKKWLDLQSDTSSIPLDKLGEQLYKIQGCSVCHSIDGSKKTGPSWKNIWGETHKFSAAQAGEPTEQVVDENYIRKSILNPSAQIREGYSNQMPSFQGRIKEREIRALSTYIKSLSDAHKQEAIDEAQKELAANAAPAPAKK